MAIYDGDPGGSGVNTGFSVTVNASGRYTAGQNSIINAGGPLSQNGSCSNVAVNRYVTTLTVTNATEYITQGGTFSIRMQTRSTTAGAWGSWSDYASGRTDVTLVDSSNKIKYRIFID